MSCLLSYLLPFPVDCGLMSQLSRPPPSVGRGPLKPLKLKRVAKLKDQEVVGVVCGTHSTAMISQDGKLFMFGSLEDDLVDSSSGRSFCPPLLFRHIVILGEDVEERRGRKRD